VRLTKVQIQDFRCIDDSGEFSIDPVTCLVGKNESGKTTVLKALHKLKSNTNDKEEFIPSKDYPKRKWRPDTTIPDEPPTIKTNWELNDADVAVIEEVFGKGVITKKQFTLHKGFDNIRRFSLSTDQVKLLQHSLPK